MAEIDTRRTTRAQIADVSETSPARIDSFLRRQSWMDPVAKAIQGFITTLYGALGKPGSLLKSTLHGTRVLGHPLHPAVTDLPLGAWTVGVVADWAAHITHAVPPQAGDIGLVVGITAALLAVASGYTDFRDTYGQERRYGLTHGLLMTSALLVMFASLGVRWLWVGDGSILAAVLATVGLVIGLGGAYFGGHLTFALGTAVNHLAFSDGPHEYIAVGVPSDFSEGATRVVGASGMPVLVARMDGRLHAIADVCSHAGGPLHEGPFKDGVVTCPWHGSRFCVRDGRVLTGPATFDQPVFDVRENQQRVEVKLARDIH